MIGPFDLRHIGCGILMGGADVIPGVSGGTVALILGIYERLVRAISRFDMTFLGHLKQKQWGPAMGHVDLGFLGAVGIGILVGIGSLASLMHYLLEHQLQHTFAAFFGLILASSLLVAGMIERKTVAAVSLLLAGGVFAYWLVGLLPANPPAGNAYVFLCGMIAICAMILPGISGAFILLIMGKYTDLTGLVRGFLHFEFSAASLLTLVAFLSGCAVGILGFSKFLTWLLERHHTATLSLLCGFMIGSLRRIWPFKMELTPPETEFRLKEFANITPDLSQFQSWFSILILLAAAGLVIALDRLSARRTAGPPTAEPASHD